MRKLILSLIAAAIAGTNGMAQSGFTRAGWEPEIVAYYHGDDMADYVTDFIELNPAFAAQGKTMQTHHPHNAFLLYWLGIGIFGLLAFIALFVVAACLPIGENRVFLWLFLFALFLQCMTEPVGAHVLPQCIALVLFVIEHGHRSALQPL